MESQAESLLKEARLSDAMDALKAEIRSNAADPRKRVFLFQLLAVTGDWDRALTQLNVAAEMDAANLLMAQVCRPALQCEALRAQIFAGQRTPVIFGEPEPWMGMMVEANRLTGLGKIEESQDLRAQAFEAAPVTPGAVNGERFEWIADADPRLGPMLEMIVDGKYVWVPFMRIGQILIEPPSDLRDMVWTPSMVRWANGGEGVAIIPSRYQGSEAVDNDAVRLARMTDWVDRGHDLFTGVGQRLLTTDGGDHGLLEIRTLEFDSAEGDAEEPGDG